MAHQHVWLKEPPDGRTSDDKYGDMRDMAHNSFWTSKEELQRLRLLVEEDPEYETSSEWPGIVEWCTSCADTRVVKLVLPEEIQVPEPGKVEESTAANSKVSCNAFTQTPTQTPRRRPRRRGGRGSRARRMLAYQLMLTVKRGLPLSRLLTIQKTEARSSEAKLQSEEFTSPALNVKEEVVIKEEKLEEVVRAEVKEEREEVGCTKERVSSSGSSNFTLRNSQSGGGLQYFATEGGESITNIATGETSPAITPYHYYPFSLSTSLTFITSKLPSQDDFHHLLTFTTR